MISIILMMLVGFTGLLLLIVWTKMEAWWLLATSLLCFGAFIAYHIFTRR